MRIALSVYIIIAFFSTALSQEKKEHPCKQWLDMVDVAIEKQSTINAASTLETIARAQQAGCSSVIKILHINPKHSSYYQAAGAQVTCNEQSGECEAKIDFNSQK